MKDLIKLRKGATTSTMEILKPCGMLSTLKALKFFINHYNF
jgi:hypothetical protein